MGGVTYFVAPATFLGDKSAAIGTDLGFDLQQVYPGSPNQFNAVDVLLQGGGLTIAYNLAANPANGSWTSFAVPLLAAGWTLDNLAGAAVTANQFQSVMSSLTALKIRAEYQTGADTGLLDNVSLVPEPTSGMLLLGGLAVSMFTSRMRKN